MRWLLITQKLDPQDDRLGFVIRWVETLAARVDHLDVICQEHADPALPPNVALYSMGKEAGVGRAVQAWRFTRHLRALVPHVDGVLCHMIPRYVLFAAPWTRRFHKPLWLWFTHRQVSQELRLAHALSTRILTASPGSFPLPSDKVTVMGHGVEADLFPASEGEHTPPEIVLVARLSRIKRQDHLLRAVSLVMQRGGAGPFRVTFDVRVVIVGGPVEGEPGYPAELEALARDLDPAPPVTFTGPLPHDQVGDVLRGCALAVNLSPPGLFDKTALESMFAARPTLVTNTDFVPLLGETADLLYLPYDASLDTLAERLARLLALTPAQRAAMGADQRARALAAHSLDGLMDRMAALMREDASHV